MCVKYTPWIAAPRKTDTPCARTSQLRADTPFGRDCEDGLYRGFRGEQYRGILPRAEYKHRVCTLVPSFFRENGNRRASKSIWL